jgi:phage terminase small subunit
MAMTDKMKMFVKEYIKDWNATQAAIRSGYSKKTAKQIGEQNLSKVDIKKAIDKEKQRISKDINSIIINNIIFWNKVIESESSRDSDRLKASELIGKYAAMFTDRTEHTTIDENGKSTGFKFVEKPDT